MNIAFYSMRDGRVQWFEECDTANATAHESLKKFGMTILLCATCVVVCCGVAALSCQSPQKTKLLIGTMFTPNLENWAPPEKVPNCVVAKPPI